MARGQVISRRRFLGGTASAAAGAGALALFGQPRRAAGQQNRSRPLAQHLSWVWTFEADAPKEYVRDTLRAHGMGILLKTHDGTNWMSRFDRSPDAIAGPEQVRDLVRFFEGAGVPFHAWCVLKGLEPIREAQMAAEVIAAGARSIFLDLEPSDGGYYWQGTPEDALIFAREFRRLQPTAWVALAPDSRPWQAAAVPMAEFAAYANEIAPQSYWRTFNSPANYRLLSQHGYHVGEEGITPELIVDVCHRTFGHYNLPIRPIGQGAADAHEWRRFVAHAYSLSMDAVSVWRHGVANPEIWPVLREMAPGPVAQAATIIERNKSAAQPPATASASPATPRQSSTADSEQVGQRSFTLDSGLRTAADQGALTQPPPPRRTLGPASIETSTQATPAKRLFWDTANLRTGQ